MTVLEPYFLSQKKKDFETNLYFLFFLRFFSPLLFQMHDFCLLVAPTIPIRDRLPLLNFGIFGSIKHSFRIGPMTPGAASRVGSSPRRRSGGATEPTVSFLWKSPWPPLSMFKPVMVRGRPFMTSHTRARGKALKKLNITNSKKNRRLAKWFTHTKGWFKKKVLKQKKAKKKTYWQKSWYSVLATQGHSIPAIVILLGTNIFFLILGKNEPVKLKPKFKVEKSLRKYKRREKKNRILTHT